LQNLIAIQPTPDDTLLRAAQAALRDSRYAPVHGLNCVCVDGVLTVWGEVASYFLKQMAQETLLQLPARGVCNQVVVR
jgi:hypothetical protein